MKQITSLFESLADENRIRIVNLLLASPVLCVNDMQRVLEIPQTRVSRHLAYLRARGIVDAQRKGTWMYYSIGSKITRVPAFKQSLRSFFANSAQCLQDIELLLEGLDSNEIMALQHADNETVEFVIENCCNMGTSNILDN
jgi:ArsR family transcriptional regulator